MSDDAELLRGRALSDGHWHPIGGSLSKRRFSAGVVVIFKDSGYEWEGNLIIDESDIVAVEVSDEGDGDDKVQ